MTVQNGNSNPSPWAIRLRGALKLIGSAKSPWIVFILAVIAIITVWWTVVRGGEDQMSHYATFAVKRGPLTISVLESGTIQAKEEIILRNEVEGKTSIVSIVPDGATVKAGDLLVELDGSALKDAIIDQDIMVQKAEAAYISAQESLAVVKNQAESDVNLAELTLEFAKEDLNQYLVGQYPNDRTAAENEITLAQEELKRAEETLAWSQKLYEQKYYSQVELMADKLAVTRSKNKLQLAENNKRLLEEFTYKRTISQLRSDVRQAEMALERTRRKAKADVAQAEADLKAKELEYQRQKEKLKKLQDQLKKTKIYAPQDGMVVYATTAGRRPWDRREPLDIGVEVYERQDLIRLPTATAMKAEVDIHETSLQKVRVGLPAVITVDALPGKKFLGHVANIAPLPDAISMWINPDLKIYPTDIYLEDNDSKLRTGMSCKAEIIIAQYDDVLYVPVQSVVRVGNEPTVYVVNGKSIEPRQVQIGLDNNRMVHIVSGLKEGELVLLTPPLEAATIESASKKAGLGTPDATDASSVMRQRINESLEKANGAKVQIPHSNFDDSAGPPTPGQPVGAAPGAENRTGQFPGISAEQIKKMRQRFEKMTPQEQQKELEKLKQKFENMPPEERKKIQQRLLPPGRKQGRVPPEETSPRPQTDKRNR